MAILEGVGVLMWGCCDTWRSQWGAKNETALLQTSRWLSTYTGHTRCQLYTSQVFPNRPVPKYLRKLMHVLISNPFYMNSTTTTIIASLDTGSKHDAKWRPKGNWGQGIDLRE